MSLTDYICWSYKKIFNEVGQQSNIVEIILCCSHKVKNLVKDINKYYTNSIRHSLMEIICSFINISEYSKIIELWKNLCVLVMYNMYDENVKTAISNIKCIVCLDVELENCIKLAANDDVSIILTIIQ